MNAPVNTRGTDFLARFAALRDRLPGNVAVRDAAADIFRASGLPSNRDEEWKFTNLRPLAEVQFSSASLAIDPAALLTRLPLTGAPRLVMLNGVLRADLSTAVAGRFATSPGFGVLAEAPLVTLNTMLAEDGIILNIPDGQDAGLIVLAHLAIGSGSFHPRHRITLAEGARLTLLEISLGEGGYLHNPVTEINIGESASLTHIRLQDESLMGFHLSTLYAEIAAHGVYDSFSLAIGARLARSEIHASLVGPHATTHLNAAQLLAGNQHADFTTVVRHAAPHGASRQTVKNVLAGRARGVFQGKIEVARGAQKTDGYQMNQALLLSPDAEIDSKPQLEIYADDVKCSHGATVGELDGEQLFYLRSRGIPEAEARAMLVHAFLAEALEAIPHAPARAVLEEAIDARWQRHAA